MAVKGIIKIVIKSFLCIFLFSIISCKTDTKKFLTEDTWGIQEIYFNDESVKGDFSSNLLSLEEDNICVVPFLHSNEITQKKDAYGTWSYNKETQKLTIESKNPYLNGEFDVCFEKNTEYKRIMLVLTSNKVSLKATKGVTVYQGKGGKLPISCNDDNVNQ